MSENTSQGSAPLSSDRLQAIISNGFAKFHLAAAACGMERSNHLANFITGTYPTPSVVKIIKLLKIDSSTKIVRLLARSEPINGDKIYSLPAAEIVYNFANSIPSNSAFFKYAKRHLLARSLKVYQDSAARIIGRKGSDAGIYHYRSGFGGRSVEVARRAGMVTLCDHSIAHPSMLDYLVEHNGDLPDRPLAPPTGFWGQVWNDIQLADAIVVNSDFVKDTFKAQNSPQIPYVVYLGIDDQFESYARACQPLDAPVDAPLRILFAGTVTKRKGVASLAAALDSLSMPWHLTIAGGIAEDMREEALKLQSNPNVRFVGNLSRSELAARMSENEVFLFPSLAEGSARVIFEALSCGCIPVTTTNSGSIVGIDPEVTGILVRPGQPGDISHALESIYRDRATLKSSRERNRQIVMNKYNQAAYTKSLLSIYEAIRR